MGRECHIVELGQRMIGLQRLAVEDVEAGMADMATLQRLDHRRLIDQRAARGVDQDRAGLHPRDARLVEKAAGLVVEHKIERDDVGLLQKRIKLDHWHAHIGSRRAIPGDHVEAHALGDARHLGADAAQSDDAERLAEHLHAFERLPGAGADVAIHAGEVAARRHHQRDGLFGDGRIAIALDGVDLDAERLDLRHAHVARSASAEKDDMLEVPALPHQIGRHVAVVVDGDIVVADHTRQLGFLKRRGVDRDWRIVGSIDALPHRAELLIAVDEDGFHSGFVPLGRTRGQVSPVIGRRSALLPAPARAPAPMQMLSPPRTTTSARDGPTASGAADRSRTSAAAQDRDRP